MSDLGTEVVARDEFTSAKPFHSCSFSASCVVKSSGSRSHLRVKGSSDTRDAKDVCPGK